MTTERAVAIIQEAREIHAKWVTWLENDPKNGQEEEPIVETAGDAAHHQRWVDNYDVVLRALEPTIEVVKADAGYQWATKVNGVLVGGWFEHKVLATAIAADVRSALGLPGADDEA